jgi:hypothetical protein
MPNAIPVRDDPAYAEAYAAFARDHPGYASAELDATRAADFARLDRSGDVYLDYTGGGIYAESHVRDHAELLTRAVFGNPHSTNPTSLAMTELAESAAARSSRTSAPTPTSTSRCSRRTPAARSSWWPSPTPSRPAAPSC